LQAESIQRRVSLTDVTSDLWTAEHIDLIEKFFTTSDSFLLVVYTSEGQIHVQHTPPRDAKDFVYFIRTDNEPITMKDHFESHVQYGLMKYGALDGLAQIMNTLFSPLLSRNPSWPQSVQNEFASGMNRFMAVLNDESHKSKGHTVLYLPNEDLDGEVLALAGSKDLVQRLEATLIHWTRQIKEVLSTNQAESSGQAMELPAQEIEFWKKRCDNMSGIAEQLDTPGVLRIQTVLDAAKSSYLSQFNTMGGRIKEGMAQAESNFRFLSTMKESFTNLGKAELKDMAAIYPRLLDLVRIVWTNSPYFNTRDNITGLLQKVRV
jgi:dynein heavy chain